MPGVGDEDAGPLRGVEGLDAINENVIEAAGFAGGMQDDEAGFLVLERAADVVNEEIAKDDVL